MFLFAMSIKKIPTKNEIIYAPLSPRYSNSKKFNILLFLSREKVLHPSGIFFVSKGWLNLKTYFVSKKYEFIKKKSIRENFVRYFSQILTNWM